MEQNLHEKDDTSRPFYEIHPSSLSFRRQMVELARYSADRAVSRKWASRLRFLQLSSSNPSSGVLPQTPNKASLPYADLAHSLSLTLTPPLDIAKSLHYVAISYCFQRTDISWFVEQEFPQIPVTLDGRSLIQDPVTDVLYRAARYAWHKDVQYIWIDQYSISQEDPIDKAKGIQAMDLVYHNASHPVTLLEIYLDDQAQLDVLACLMTGDEIKADQIDALEYVLDILSQDAWFTRAWTLQEATSAGPKMMLLIACDPKLEKSSIFGSILGEIEISTWHLHENFLVLVRNYMEAFIGSGMLEDDSIAISASNLADIIYFSLPQIYPDDISDPETPHRQNCNAAEAINHLQERQNSYFPDRLAILANLCNYEVRIDASVLEMPEYAFSTCVLTLAILNGDMSLLGEYTPVPYISRSGQTHIGYKRDLCDSRFEFGFSWGPNPKGRLRDVEYFNQHKETFVLQPALLSEHGLITQGILWSTNHSITAPKTQVKFASRYRRELESLEKMAADGAEFNNRITPFVQDFFWSLLHELVECGWLDLARALWNFFRPRQRYSRKPVTDYSFETVFLSPHEFDEQLVIRAITAVIIYVDVESEVYKEPSFSRIIIEQVCNNGTLTCASQMGSETPRAIFEACNLQDLVFTPFTNLGDTASAGSIFEGQAMSWKVLHTGTRAEQCDILHCLGRRRGFYRIEDLAATNFILE